MADEHIDQSKNETHMRLFLLPLRTVIGYFTSLSNPLSLQRNPNYCDAAYGIAAKFNNLLFARL